MNLISREELKKKIDNNDEFKLVMTLGDFAFNAKHIPGSIQVDNEEKTKKLLSIEDEIVVYCSGPNCTASINAYNLLTKAGFTNIRRFAGGIEEWEDAGYPLEGNSAD
jgi:rhodanese-related sulfurtransferase